MAAGEAFGELRAAPCWGPPPAKGTTWTGRWTSVADSAASWAAGQEDSGCSGSPSSADSGEVCGIVGIVTSAGTDARSHERELVTMRDRLAHRGPDGAGAWFDTRVALGHRRLAVLDLSDDGKQPMEVTTAAGARHVISYNGELYNEPELRQELTSRGVVFRSTCDTETVLRALAVWGESALQRFRGMFAFAWYSTDSQQLLLARDPLGIKPLYWTRRLGAGAALGFASEIPGLLAHPSFSPAPDPLMVSAYLTTIRTVLGSRTLYRDVHAVEPGHLLRVSWQGSDVTVAAERWFEEAAAIPADDDHSVKMTRDAIEDSLECHLRSDVTTCALLSGGLDSTITATLAKAGLPDLRTYCAGARGALDDDFAHAREVARSIGSEHSEAVVGPGGFIERWSWMIRQLASPLSTPNEVAIYEVAAALRSDGCVVTISGEGADELFAGYEGPIDAMHAASGAGHEDGGLFQLLANAWVTTDAKRSLLNGDWLGAIEEDAWLHGHYREVWAACRATEGTIMRAHLRLLRQINLTGLLQRLDTATMLASVEGRTPFADVRVAEVARRLPIEAMYASKDEAPTASVRTKLVLREAFSQRVPRSVLLRPKASFPLPFQQWMKPMSERVRRSEFIRSIVRRNILTDVTNQPAEHWWLAWPLFNLAVWSEQWR